MGDLTECEWLYHVDLKIPAADSEGAEIRLSKDIQLASQVLAEKLPEFDLKGCTVIVALVRDYG